MSEGKNLSLQRCSRLKGLPSRRKQRENDREHVTEKLQRRLPKFNQFSQNGVFGRDSRRNAARRLSLCGFELRQALERVVERHEVLRRAPADHAHCFQGDTLVTCAALFVVTPGVVDKNAAHHLCGDSEEVRAILPVHAIAVREAQVGFVHQGGGLQDVPGALPAHGVAGEAAKLFINEGSELFERGFIAVRPGAQQ
jgi:hypothetical protein